MRKLSRKIKKIVKSAKKAQKTLKTPLKKLKPKKIQKKFRKLADKISLQKIFTEPAFSVSQNGHSFERAQESFLPAYYEENKITLLVRDPWWIFAFWEVTPWRRGEVCERALREGHSPDKIVLRVHNLSENSFFDIEVGSTLGQWYVDVGKPDCEWRADLGVRTREGKFFVFVSSNSVKTPRYGVSDVLDEEWMLPDELYWKIFGISSGFGRQKSSADVKEILERYLKNIASSESLSRTNLGQKS